MARKAKTHKDATIAVLQEHLHNNSLAIKEGPRRKSFSIHDLKSIKPLTFPQKSMMESFFSGNHIVANGCAGSGKTLVALFLALNEVLSKDSVFKHINIVRSAVSSRSIGFLSGSESEKLEVYELPYKELCTFLLGKHDAYDVLKENGVINFCSTSYVRGRTWSDSIVIVDEAASANLHEISSCATRLGDNSRLIVIGDNAQTDLIYNKYDVSGFPDFLKIAERMDEFDIIEFTKNDIVRSGFVKSYLTAYEDFLDSFE